MVATPIGNLADLSQRALSVLEQVDWIAAEDTRHTKKLLNHYQIDTRLFALHEHNEQQAAEKVLQLLAKGESVALVSDAGTPLISDPGRVSVQQALQTGVKLVPVPGPCAFITALSVSGLPAPYQFVGFLPAKGEVRAKALVDWKNSESTLAFYEAPQRIVDFLQLACRVFGEAREAVIGRELTKQFETIYHGNLKTLLETMQNTPEQQRGEFVVLIAGSEKINVSEEEQKRVLKILLAKLPLKQAVAIATDILQGNKNQLYQLALTIKDS